jgi:hypothetical protein
MASVVELVAVGAIVVFAIGAVFGVIFIVVAGIKAEENVARRRRATTLHGQPASAMNRGVRKLLTGARD